MPHDLQVSHLKALIAIAEENSFEAAATRVGRTQSAVTQQMQKLEDRVGKPLFRTVGRRRELTSAGRTLVTYGREIVSLVNHALAATDRATETGVVTIGAPQEVAEELLPRILSRFVQDWPHIRVTIHVGRSPALMSMLGEGRLDVTLSTRRADKYEGALIATLPSLWIAGASYRHDPKMPLPLILADEPSMFRRIALAALDLSGISSVERFTSPDLAGVRLCVAAGLGVTVRTESSFFSETRILGEAEGLPPLPDVNYYVYRSPTTTSPAARALYESIRTDAASQRQPHL
ncbi:LysR substrate-binding domain-containing protein [Algihabitans albus]|uniref:LysR substrate-binding domain-containing protein n=1 Tax=Algihabitans albus TaxID=2164067 RepID=UPI0035D07424